MLKNKTQLADIVCEVTRDCHLHLNEEDKPCQSQNSNIKNCRARAQAKL